MRSSRVSLFRDSLCVSSQSNSTAAKMGSSAFYNVPTDSLNSPARSTCAARSVPPSPPARNPLNRLFLFSPLKKKDNFSSLLYYLLRFHFMSPFLFPQRARAHSCTPPPAHSFVSTGILTCFPFVLWAPALCLSVATLLFYRHFVAALRTGLLALKYSSRETFGYFGWNVFHISKLLLAPRSALLIDPSSFTAWRLLLNQHVSLQERTSYFLFFLLNLSSSL